MTDVKHPKDLLEAISGHNTMEEGGLRHPRCLPVVLNLGYFNNAHVEDDGKECLKLTNGELFPVGELAASRKLPSCPELFDSLCCIPECKQAMFTDRSSVLCINLLTCWFQPPAAQTRWCQKTQKTHPWEKGLQRGVAGSQYSEGRLVMLEACHCWV